MGPLLACCGPTSLKRNGDWNGGQMILEAIPRAEVLAHLHLPLILGSEGENCHQAKPRHEHGPGPTVGSSSCNL